MGVALIIGIDRWHKQRDLTVRLLVTAPDEIPLHPDLNRVAMARGKRAFAQYCARCHGASGRADPSNGVPDLRDSDWLYGSGRIDEIERVVLYGIRAGYSKGWNLASMPAFATPVPYSRYQTPSLTPEEVSDVTEYIYAFQHAGFDAAAAARGRLVYEDQSKGVCWDCHGGRAQGDPGIGAPNLSDRIWLYGDGSRDSIRTSISFGRGGTCPGWINTLSADTVIALAVYAHSLSTTTAVTPN